MKYLIVLNEWSGSDRDLFTDTCTGRCGGGGGDTRALLDPIVFNFMQFLGEIGPNISLMSPSGVGAYIWEIPDPPLL